MGLARRHLTNLGMAQLYQGKDVTDGEDYNVFEDQERDDEARNPFRCVLDVGLARTSTGARIFSVMKGACDGGLDIPHSTSRLAGNDAEYMRSLQEESEEKYKRQFSRYIAAGIGADDIEKLYESTHSAIRQNPAAQKKTPSVPKGEK